MPLVRLGLFLLGPSTVSQSSGTLQQGHQSHLLHRSIQLGQVAGRNHYKRGISRGQFQDLRRPGRDGMRCRATYDNTVSLLPPTKFCDQLDYRSSHNPQRSSRRLSAGLSLAERWLSYILQPTMLGCWARWV